MSFFKSLKGLADDFKDLMSDKDKEQKIDQNSTSNRGANDSYYQSQPEHNNTQQHFSQNSFQQYQQHPSEPHPQQQHQYGQLPSQPYQPRPGPQLPPGWIQQWDQNSQRYYYIEQTTGRSQWDPPAQYHDQSRWYGGPPIGQYNQMNGQSYGQSQSYAALLGLAHPGGSNYPHEAVASGEKNKSNKGALLAAGAGGLAVGGLASAALADDSSDDETHAAAASAPYGAAPAAYGAPPTDYGYGAPPPATDPQALEHNSDVSSSQRNSLESARHEYEEAAREAADSDASSSDREEAEEKRREYEEEIEEAEEEAYDD